MTAQPMTEEQAREKWCPFARMPAGDPAEHHDAPAVNRFTPQEPATRCLGPACAKWGWVRGGPSAQAVSMPVQSDDGQTYGRCTA